MVAAMRYISLMGHIGNMNHVVSRYLSRYEIQLQQGAVKGLTEPFTTLNPYSQTLQKAETLSKIVGPPPALYMPLTSSQAVNMVEESALAFENRNENLMELEGRLTRIEENISNLQNYEGLSSIENLIFIHHQTGRFSKTNYRQYEKFLSNDPKFFFIPTKHDQNHTWGIYFTPMADKAATDSVFASLGFEVISIHFEGGGTAAEVLSRQKNEAEQLKQEIKSQTLNIFDFTRLAVACEKVRLLYAAFDIKKYAALSKNKRIFTFSGWMAETEAKILEEEIVHDNLAVFVKHIDENENPPVILKNPPVIRQFEFFTRLYGLPKYGEIDPTPILAITYTLLFGLMFGDVGHGFVLALLGLYIRRKSPLGSIISIVGVSAVIFGFLYGSIFGFEDILPALWIRPGADIGQTLIFAAILGVGLISLAMMIYMYNAFKQGRFTDLLFGANGAAGFIFYAAVLWIGVRVLVFGLPVTFLVLSVAVLPLLFVAFKHPLEIFISGEGFPEKPVEFIFTMAVELFETILSYVTNTVSFIRVGAFAIIHAGMMHVVLQLAQGAAGFGHFLVIIAGNILVMGIEGLLVGIQSLRLDFYELFSRFYSGGGRVFYPQNRT